MGPRRLRGALPLVLALACLALACCVAACGPSIRRETVFYEDRTQADVRWYVKRGEPIDQGYDHPTTIAPVRLAHILSRIDIRVGKDGNERRPAIPTETLYTVANGLAAALTKADRTQEVAILSIRKTKRFGLFDRDYLTSFVAYVKGDQLYLHLSRSDDELDNKQKDRLPQPRIGKVAMRFRVLPSKGMSVVDSQSVAADWRDEVFARPTRTSITATGRVVRRTILMESPDESEEVPQAGQVPDHLSPRALRQLADLEERRRRGEITESYYEARRREIIGADSGGPP